MHADLANSSEWTVLVPGFTGSKEDFIAVLAPLAAAGIGSLTFDQLGQHESDASGEPGDYAITALAADLGAVIDEAARRFDRADPPHLVGHSFGGLVSQQALINGDVRPASFVALCTGPGALPAERWSALPDLVAALPDTGLDAIWSRVKELDAAAGKPAPPEDIEAFLHRRWLANSPVQLRQCALLLMEQPSLTADMRTVVDAGLPMTVMWGERDDAWPLRVQARMAEDLAVGAVEIPGAGHSPNADSPDALVTYLLAAWRP